jgi:hypothetical protein
LAGFFLLSRVFCRAFLTSIETTAPPFKNATHPIQLTTNQISPAVAEAAFERTELLPWLLARVKRRAADSNRLYASELLAVFVTGHEANAAALGRAGGVDALLVSAAPYKSRDPQVCCILFCFLFSPRRVCVCVCGRGCGGGLLGLRLHSASPSLLVPSLSPTHPPTILNSRTTDLTPPPNAETKIQIKDDEEAEYLENVFDALCCALMLPANRALFVEAEVRAGGRPGGREGQRALHMYGVPVYFFVLTPSTHI